MRVGEGQSAVKSTEQYKCELLPEAEPVENKGVEQGLVPSGAGRGDSGACLFPQRALCPPRSGTDALREPSS